MRIKLDENLPESCLAVLADFGHTADTVRAEGLTGARDPDLFAAVQDDGRVLITLDRGFGDVRAYPPGTHRGIVVLRLTDQRTAFVIDALRVFLERHQLDDLAGCIVVVQRGLVRIRWPDAP